MARLNVDFSALHAAVAKMGASDINFSINISSRPLELIDIQLEEGIEVPLDEIEHDSGLLAYQGRQILLYIKDHGWNVSSVMYDSASGNKYHVADCRTLQSMRQRNRFDRYVVTNKLTGEFEISGINPVTQETQIGIARLKVCKNCLNKLNYKGYKVGGSRNVIFGSFNLDEFFKTYSSYFKYLPQQTANEDVQYSDDWAVVAGRFKADQKFTCQQCSVDLTEHKKHLHVHHINAVKSDNRQANLKALCVDCHRKQDGHGHMFVNHKTMQLISSLRREQSIGSTGGWNMVIELADPGVAGLLMQCKSSGVSMPIVGYEIQGSDTAVVAELELAWPPKKVGVAISQADKHCAEKHGWEVWEMVEALDNYSRFKTRLLRSYY